MFESSHYPPTNGIVTILSDYGLADHYVAEVKGAMLCASSSLRIVDVTHGLSPRNIDGAAYVLGHSAFAFPPGSVHLALVDPGVGTERALLVCLCGDHYFFAPDNGILSWALRANPFECRRMEFQSHELPPCRTFHGRDLLAPAAARLAAGDLQFDQCGPPWEPKLLESRLPVRTGDIIEGRVVRADRFGNLVVNVSRSDVADARVLAVEIGGQSIGGLVRCFGEREHGDLVALWGSDGYLEVSVVLGSAGNTLEASPGMPVKLVLQT
jgi:S-adenosyl-L-methionine hydrolase (adenosine-forming)